MSSEFRATYRLQLGPELTFDDARALVPYLRDLGISHVYLSPSLQARAGSTHGYDVVDPTRVSEELGGEEGLRALAAEIGVVLDIVPNHMGTGDENRWWPDRDVFDFEPGSDFYRRFFDIDDLGALRVEREDVFDLVHGKVLELVRDGVLDGVRVDHPDGLADPAGYFRRLREKGVPAVWIEKILHPGEPLRDWPVDGTVGYEFLVDATSLFVDGSAEGLFTELYGELTGENRDFAEVAREAQLEQATGTFRRELAWLNRLAPQFTELEIAEALAALPVYRTYSEPWSGQVDPLDRRYIEAAQLPRELAGALLLEEGGLDEFVTRFQQTSPPVTAKGIEDTAFYRYNRLIALNEVGNDPARFGIDVAAMHAANLQRAERFPRNLLISSTHDTKRSADVRARIAALTLPGLREKFAALARQWVPTAPDPNEGWMILQTLLGAWPIELERLDGFIEKALREAKVNTSWVDQDHDHEARVQRWARELVADPEFRRAFAPLVDRVSLEGATASLGQVALKLTAPGIPDVYGGDELDFRALVDPDNRRPVDFDVRRRALAADTRREPKLHLIKRALDLRARKPEAFAGAYEPIGAGPDVLAYARGDAEVIVVIGRFEHATGVLSLPPSLRGTWRHILTGASVDLADGMRVPGGGVAILERD